MRLEGRYESTPTAASTSQASAGRGGGMRSLIASIVVVATSLGATLACGSERATGGTDDLGDGAADESRIDLGLGCEAQLGCAGLATCDVTFPQAGLFPTPPDAPVEGSLDCVVDHLLGTEPVRVEVLFSDGGMLQGGDTILVYGDGTAARRYFQLGEIFERPYQRVEIRPPEHFEACRNSADTTVLRACLTDWFVPDTCVGDVCCPLDEDADHACP